jgi:hypothetical protein
MRRELDSRRIFGLELHREQFNFGSCTVFTMKKSKTIADIWVDGEQCFF